MREAQWWQGQVLGLAGRAPGLGPPGGIWAAECPLLALSVACPACPRRYAPPRSLIQSTSTTKARAVANIKSQIKRTSKTRSGTSATSPSSRAQSPPSASSTRPRTPATRDDRSHAPAREASKKLDKAALPRASSTEPGREPQVRDRQEDRLTGAFRPLRGSIWSDVGPLSLVWPGRSACSAAAAVTAPRTGGPVTVSTRRSSVYDASLAAAPLMSASARAIARIASDLRRSSPGLVAGPCAAAHGGTPTSRAGSASAPRGADEVAGHPAGPPANAEVTSTGAVRRPAPSAANPRAHRAPAPKARVGGRRTTLASARPPKYWRTRSAGDRLPGKSFGEFIGCRCQ